MKYCVFDLESVPSQSLPEGVKPEFDPESVKIGGMKDPVKMNDKIEKARQEFEQGLDKKMSLDPDLCEVVCFSIDVESHKWTYGHDQPCLICDAWDEIKNAYFNHIPLVSFNGIQFDLPVLWHSAMKLGIPVSPQMYEDLTKKYSKGFTYHYDLLQLLSGWQRDKYRSLDFYLKLFGIGEKFGEGSEIYGWWKAKEYDKIREHCEQDVELTGKLFERLEGWIVKEV